MFLLLRYARTAYLTAAPPTDATHRPPPVPEGVASLGPCYRTIMCSPLQGKDTAAGPRHFLKLFRRHRWIHQRDGAKYSTPYTTILGVGCDVLHHGSLCGIIKCI